MSGIGGIAGHSGNALALATICESMKESLKRRGKDEHGTYMSEEISMIHTSNYVTGIRNGPERAVMGQQAYIIVFDGELYNRAELLRELWTFGYRIPENSDAAIVLHAYIAWGEICVEKFLGAYAFAIWDSQRLFIARDRLGLRPLYYSHGAHGLVFASDIKTLLCHPGVTPVVGAEGIADIMLLGPGRTPGTTPFRNISELQPAHFATYTRGVGLKVNEYWRLKAKPHREAFDETAAIVRKILTNAVARQNQDRIGTMLSGGLDSSALARLANSRATFSVDYVGNDRHFTESEFQPDDDNAFIKEMVEHLGARHNRCLLGSDELADALLPAMHARGLPGMADVDSALLLFCQNVKRSVPVVLSGEGADEIFGGYPWYQNEERLFADTFPWSQKLEYRASFMSPDIKIDHESYVRARYEKTINGVDTLYDDSPKEKRIRQMYHLNIHWFLQTLATRNEAMSAAAGLTVRIPFLDHRLVEYMYNVPWEYKNQQNREKGLLREALVGLLPENILWRKKSPFPKTHNPAYMNRVTDMIKDVMEDKSAPLHGVVPKDAIEKLLNAQTKEPWYGQLMTVPQTIAYFLQINMWLREFNVKLTM